MKTKRVIGLVLALVLCVTMMQQGEVEAKKVVLKTKKISMKIGGTKVIKLQNKKKKAKYVYSSKNTKIATVSKTGKIKAKRAGTTSITVKEKLKKKSKVVGKVKVMVSKKKVVSTAKPVATSTSGMGTQLSATETPQVTQSAEPTKTPEPTKTTEPTMAGPTSEPTMVPSPASDLQPKQDPLQPETEQSYNTDTLTLTKSYSEMNGELMNNPLITTRYIADPTCIEYEGRLYVYGTSDYPKFNADGTMKDNGYTTTNLSCISTEDMVNWRDEGIIETGTTSWAPSVISKVMDGKEKFFLFFANSTGGIKELTADSPLGPWKKATKTDYIVSRDDLEYEVPWVFDPGVMKDEKGDYYIAVGGGISSKEYPHTSRLLKLGDDMVSLDSAPQQVDAPYNFEDNEMNQINGTYYYSYCANWSCPYGPAGIAYMTSDSPLSGYVFRGILFQNPGKYFGLSYNNHHHMFEFKNQWYLLYHTTVLEYKMYGTTKGYRNLQIDKLNVAEDGSLSATGTNEGVGSVATLNPFYETNATTMAWNGGLGTVYSESLEQMVVDQINTGDWLGVNNVDFASGATKVTMKVASETMEGSIEIHLDSADGKKVGEIALSKTDNADTYTDVSAELTEKVDGKHDVFFVFRGKDYHVASWKFE